MDFVYVHKSDKNYKQILLLICLKVYLSNYNKLLNFKLYLLLIMN